MTGARGHRVVEHTADEILEAWGPSRAACLEEAATGFVALFVAAAPSAVDRRHIDLDGTDERRLLLDLLDEVLFLAETENVVPAAVHVEDRGEQVQVSLDLAPIGPEAATGPTPKGIALSGLRLATEDGRWYARALVDV